MSAFGAWLLSWAQSAEFYTEFHERAVEAVGQQETRDWLDVGCGPGLLSRLAARRGYAVTGVDISRHMIDAARSLSAGNETYIVRGLDGLVAEGAKASVVSASSLLVVIPNPELVLGQLERLVRPGGLLLVIEAGNGFNWRTGVRALFDGRIRGRLQFLVWLFVRSGRTVDESLFRREKRPFRKIELLEGMAAAWILKSADAR